MTHRYDAPEPGQELRAISVFDTTLRDGEQAPGNAMTAEQKTAVGRQLEKLGVDVLEVGCPASSEEDFRAARMLAQATSNATLATFCRANHRDIDIALDAIGSDRHQVQLLATASDIHLIHKRGISRTEAVRELVGAVKYATQSGVTNVSAGLEDASRSDSEFLRTLAEEGVAAGATTIVIGDTTGCCTPREIARIVADVRGWIPDYVTLAIHCHDDMGLALANALAGVQAGADQVQTTLAGIGERSGNTALEELAAVLHYKAREFGATTRIWTPGIYEAFLVLKDAINLRDLRNKAIVGNNAFGTAAGIHQAGILQNPRTYEYLEPEQFGRERSMFVGRHSGRSIIRYLLKELSLSASDDIVEQLYRGLVAKRTGPGIETLDETRHRIVEHVGHM